MRSSRTFALTLLLLFVSSRRAAAELLSPGDIVVTSETSIVRVDPLTGDRTIVSDSTHGTGPALLDPGIAIEPSGSIYVSNSSSVLRVDPVTGNRTIISDGTHGTGPNFSSLPNESGMSITLGPDGSLYLFDQFAQNLLRVDPVTGDRTLIASDYVEIGAMLFDQGILLANSYGALLQIDLATGDHTVVSGESRGTGATFTLGGGLASDGAGGLLDAEVLSKSLLLIDPATGNRTIVSQGPGSPGYAQPRGAGPAFTNLAGVAVAPNGQWLVADNSGILFSVDPLTGDRTVFSEFGVAGSGAAFTPIYVAVYVPEPSSLVLLLSAGCWPLVLICKRRWTKLRTSTA